jgi:hypothetical protein
MKDFEIIKQEIGMLGTDLILTKREHNNLNQIDMISYTGSKLREKINLTKGMILALEWVIQNDLNGYLCERHDME